MQLYEFKRNYKLHTSPSPGTGVFYSLHFNKSLKEDNKTKTDTKLNNMTRSQSWIVVYLHFYRKNQERNTGAGGVSPRLVPHWNETSQLWCHWVLTKQKYLSCTLNVYNTHSVWDINKSKLTVLQEVRNWCNLLIKPFSVLPKALCFSCCSWPRKIKQRLFLHSYNLLRV